MAGLNNVIKIAVSITLSVCLLACGGDEGGDSPLTLPTNLTVTINVSETGNGEVSVNASADNTNYYNIFFENGQPPVRTTTGQASYSYAIEGDYTIRVQAHATASAYTSQEKTVTIELPDFIIPTTGYTSPASYDGMTLVWEDNFEGPSLNSSYWTFEIGRGENGWGNNELQYYREQNTSLQDGNLIITAKKENFAGAEYTSSRIITQNKKYFRYGRFDIRAILPKGQGLWPALWMLGQKFSTVGWPKSGEIDIMELVGGTPSSTGRNNKVYGTLHWWNDSSNSNACTCEQGTGYTLNNGTFADEFHVFSIVWDQTNIRWYVDNTLFHTINITPANLNEFHEEFFFIFNVAVGGNWPGSPEATTVFPQRMIVDYIRVFQKN